MASHVVDDDTIVDTDLIRRLCPQIGGAQTENPTARSNIEF